MIKYDNHNPEGLQMGATRPIMHRGFNLNLPSVNPVDKLPDKNAPKNIYGRDRRKKWK